jgi:GAF domain-containing protein
VRDQVIGVIDAQKPDGSGAWTQDEVALLEAMLDQLGSALESARLYQDTQRQAAREQTIGQVATRIRESLDLETMLRTATGEIRQALNLGDVIIRLVAPNTAERAR